MAVDGLNRKESCGGHFREEYQDEEGETLRDDVNFKYVASWEYVIMMHVILCFIKRS
jgi:succinate dehydrogenase / fumarate reductase flavoprotein subunit